MGQDGADSGGKVKNFHLGGPGLRNFERALDNAERRKVSKLERWEEQHVFLEIISECEKLLSDTTTGEATRQMCRERIEELKRA